MLLFSSSVPANQPQAWKFGCMAPVRNPMQGPARVGAAIARVGQASSCGKFQLLVCANCRVCLECME